MQVSKFFYRFLSLYAWNLNFLSPPSCSVLLCVPALLNNIHLPTAAWHSKISIIISHIIYKTVTQIPVKILSDTCEHENSMLVRDGYQSRAYVRGDLWDVTGFVLNHRPCAVNTMMTNANAKEPAWPHELKYMTHLHMTTWNLVCGWVVYGCNC